MPDSADWLDRLSIVGIDLRDPAQVVALADSVAAQGPLDILINNAAQTVRRSPGAYTHLADAELEPLPDRPLPQITTFGRTSSAHPVALAGSVTELTSISAGAVASLALTAEHASLERLVAGTAIDAGGLVPDTAETNSWVHTVDQVDPMELLEVQLCNQTAPFILVSRLRGAMKATEGARAYVVNVSAMEGVFSRGYKGPGHPHTNMAKAALNMLTRTSATELADRRHPHDQRRHRLDHRRAPPPDQGPAGRGGLPRPARPGRRRGPRVRPDRARRGRRGPVRLLPQGLRAFRLVVPRGGLHICAPR